MLLFLVLVMTWHEMISSVCSCAAVLPRCNTNMSTAFAIHLLMDVYSIITYGTSAKFAS
jgi:hypothetical protein